MSYGDMWERLLDGRELARCQKAARELSRRFGLDELVAPYANRRWSASQAGRPVLHLDDFSAIPFLVDISGVEEYQHRARLRTRGGELFCAVTAPTEGYEEYCLERLCLEPVDFLALEPTEEGPLFLGDACRSPLPFEHLVSSARKKGGLLLHPFMAIDGIWDLAALISERSAVPVTVLGPPPPVTWMANDKQSFGDVVASVLGEDWLVESHGSSDPAALAKSLLDLANRVPTVGLKRLRCASAMGNEVHDSTALVDSGIEGVELLVRRFLDRTEWDGIESVLAVSWEHTDLSPSTQLWIPPLDAGPPRLDGIYLQILAGEEKVFVGSRPSTLPKDVEHELAGASLALGATFQALGYVGRCSFDFLLLGEPEGEHSLKLTECNGRWGGTSTPMAFLDRLLDGPRPAYRAQDVIHPDLVGAAFSEVLACLGDEAYDRRTGLGRYLLYNVGPLKGSGKLDVIALGETMEQADEAMEVDLPRLLGLG